MSQRASLAIVGLQPQSILPLGRYVLDADGRLHAWRHRGFIKGVAVVTIRLTAKKSEIPARGNQTADHGGGCEGSAPEGTSGALARAGVHPANADQRQSTAPRPVAEGLVPCRCGASAPGLAHGLVPQWFGRDCIERDCALKVPA